MANRFSPLMFLLVFCFGCSAATKPNISSIYRVPSLAQELEPLSKEGKPTNEQPLPMEVQLLFERLYASKHVFAKEVGRLPEFQGDPGEKQVLALARFVDLIQQATSLEKAKLKEFLELGNPDVRRYCVPLQAIFWLLELDRYESETSPLTNNLEWLLAMAWDFSDKHRWKRFTEVTERLNAPELIDYYERRQIGYSRGHSYDMSPLEVFTMKTGHCISVTALTVYCLRKAGYKAWDHRVASPTGHPAGHHVAAFESNGEKYVMDNGRPNPRGIIPFESYSP